MAHATSVYEGPLYCGTHDTGNHGVLCDTQLTKMALSEESSLINEHSKLEKLSEKLSLWKRRYRRSHKCVSSRAVILVLCWSFSVNLMYNSIFEGADYLFTTFFDDLISVRYYFILYAFQSFIMCFYPLAGFLADTKYGRFKMISRSHYCYC